MRPLRCLSICFVCFFFFSSRRRHTRCLSDWSSDVCSSDLCGFVCTGESVLCVAGLASPVRGGGGRLGCLGKEERALAVAGRRRAVGLGNYGVFGQIGRASCRE